MQQRGREREREGKKTDRQIDRQIDSVCVKERMKGWTRHVVTHVNTSHMNEACRPHERVSQMRIHIFACVLSHSMSFHELNNLSRAR